MSSELTAELRFWWHGEAPAAVKAWFAALGPGEAERRCDIYSPTDRSDWGIKQRGGDGPIESKMALAPSLPVPNLPDARLWLKQTVEWDRLPGSATMSVQKERQMYSIMDTAGEPRCVTELGRARAGEGSIWTTLCIEAQADLSDPLRNLSLAWTEGSGLPTGLGSGWCASYPEWLMRLTST